MREIKFMVWDGGAWVEPHLFVIYNGNVYATPRDFEDGRKLKNCNLVEYTGMKDKNGTEIYEGDVCEIEGGGEKTSVGKIIFEYGCFCFKPNGARFGTAHPELKYYVDMEFCEIEVIGNIYESPDLLNEPVRNPNKLD